MNTWSLESTQVPPISPVTQPGGRGLGQNGSTTNLGEFRPRAALTLTGCHSPQEIASATTTTPTYRHRPFTMLSFFSRRVRHSKSGSTVGESGLPADYDQQGAGWAAR